MKTLSEVNIKGLAKPAQIRNGKELARAGMVEILESSPTKVRGKVQGLTPGASTRKTELLLKNGKLSWSCTCTKNSKNFCKHLVATAFVSLRKLS